MKLFVFNGWAAGPETWSLCTFTHDWIFDYIEQMDGLPERVMAETDSAVLVGFSMGGAMALRTALNHPKKTRGLVLVSATPRMMEDKASDWRGMSLHRKAALKLGTQMMFRADPSPLYREDNLDKGLDFLQSIDLRAELIHSAASLKFPVHIIQSERDGIVRPNNAAFLKSVFSQAKVTMVPGSEHVLPITTPELIDDAIKECLSQLKKEH